MWKGLWAKSVHHFSSDKSCSWLDTMITGTIQYNNLQGCLLRFWAHINNNYYYLQYYYYYYYKTCLRSMLSCHSLVFQLMVSWNTICVKWIDKLRFWFTLCAKVCTCAFRRKANGSFSWFWGISVLFWVAEELIKPIETRRMIKLDYQGLCSIQDIYFKYRKDN